MKELEEKLGHRFANSALLNQALTHPSYRNEQPGAADNQRMEYLGDASLGLAAAHYFYLRFPTEPEGRLTLLRTAVASTTTLADIARELGLGDFMILGRGEEQSGGRQKERNLANTMEAVIGAVYLDGGQDAVERLFARLLANRIEGAGDSLKASNPKGMLTEWAQQHGHPVPEYEIVHEEGPSHQKLFSVRVQIADRWTEEGTGSTKRAAEAMAAERLLARLGRET